MRRSTIPAVLATFLVALSASAADIVIDDFSVAQSLTYSTATPPFQVNDESADHAGIFRGERNLQIGGPNLNGGIGSIDVSGGTMTWHRPLEGSVTLRTFWDGDNDSTTFDPGFGSGVDLTAGGLNTFRITAVSSTSSTQTLQLRVYSDGSNYSTAVFNVPSGGGNIDLRMDSFVRTGSGANFASVRAISLDTWAEYSQVNYDAVFDSISVVRTAGPSLREIGPNDFRLTEPTLTFSERVNDLTMADNGTNQALAVWVQRWYLDPNDANQQYEVWARRIDTTTGGTIGSLIRVSFMNGDTADTDYEPAYPDVAYNATANEYLVVWSGHDPSFGADDFEIFGQRIDAATGALIGSMFRISFMGPNGDFMPYADEPSVAWDSVHNRYLVTWIGADSSDEQEAESEIYGRILNGDGTSYSADDLRLTTIGPDGDLVRQPRDPEVAFDPAYNGGDGRFLVVFRVNHEAQAQYDIYGQFVNPDGTESGPDDFPISDMGSSNGNFVVFAPKLAFSPAAGEFLVVWHGDDVTPGDDKFEIFGQRINATTGAEVGTNDFRISDTGPAGSNAHWSGAPDVTWDAATNSYVVAFSGNPVNDERWVMLQRLTANGTAIGDRAFRVSQTVSGVVPAIVSGNALAVAWQGFDVADSGHPGVFGQLVELLIPSAATTTITAAPESIAANGVSTSAITVQARTAANELLLRGEATVTLNTTSGSLSAVTDHGDGTYTAVLTSSLTAGVATITGTIDGNAISDNALVSFIGPATNFLVDAPANATAGSPFNITVTARDSAGQTATGYTGTVRITSTAASATLPGNYTFTPADAGVRTFSLSLNSAGSIVVTATDTVTSSITGNDTVAVAGNTNTALATSKTPTLVGETVTFTATVTAAATGTITGNVTFKDGATPLGSSAISGGIATFSTSALTQGVHSITAEYTGSASFNGSTSGAVSQTVNLSPFGPPAIVNASATGTSAVAVNWTAVANATGYRIYRATSIQTGFTQIGTSAGLTFSDSGRSANTTYVYKVAADGPSGTSAPSAADAATTIVFTDSSLAGVTIKATHLAQLRTAVEAMRSAANLGAGTYTDATITGGVTRIKAMHLTELRTALDQARTQLGLTALSYTDPVITATSTRAKAQHWSEVRAGTQ